MFAEVLDALNYIAHLLSDLGIFLGFLGQMIGQILGKLGLPFEYVFGFIRDFWSSATATLPTSDLFVFDSEILSVFNSIPHWTTLTSILGAGILIITGFAIFKVFQRI